MRNLVIARIRELMLQFPDLQFELDIEPDQLDNMSNVDLLDLFEEIFAFDGD